MLASASSFPVSGGSSELTDAGSWMEAFVSHALEQQTLLSTYTQQSETINFARCIPPFHGQGVTGLVHPEHEPVPCQEVPLHSALPLLHQKLHVLNLRLQCSQLTTCRLVCDLLLEAATTL